MFKLDHWEELEASGDYDAKTLVVAKELAFDMCREIFERLGLSTMTNEVSLRVSGRGTTVVFPLRGNSVPLKYIDRVGTPRCRVTRGR